VIADALVIVLTPGSGLEEWHQAGILRREWALYQRMAPSFGRLIVVTDTRQPSPKCMSVLCAESVPVSVVANPDSLDHTAWLANLGQDLPRALDGCESLVIKTNQFSASETALRILRHANNAGKRAALIARGGYLWSRHESDTHGPSSRTASEVASREGELCRAAHLVVGTTNDMLEDLAWRYGIEPEHTRLIPNYILDSGPLLTPDDRKPNTVLMCGQLIERKRVALALRAAQLLSETTPIRIECVGDGPMRSELEALAKHLEVDAQFTPHLGHDDLLELMRHCTVFVQMSQREGHPKTVLEAMSAGAPVVVADAPSLGDQITHGVTGLMCPAEPSALAHVLGPLVEDKDWRESLGESAQLHIRRVCALDVVVPKELEAVREALASATQKCSARGAVSAIRWTPELLRETPERAAQAWHNSLHAYAQQLEPSQATRFLTVLDSLPSAIQNTPEAARKAG